jgi:hypothetical protein
MDQVGTMNPAELPSVTRCRFRPGRRVTRPRAMRNRLPRWLLLGSLALIGCASVRPSFERRFSPEFRSSRDLWMRLLASRYGCDTALVVAASQSRSVNVGAGPCDLATFAVPEVVDAWQTASGIREEWKFRMKTGEPLLSVYLEGSNERTLRVVPPAPRMQR